MGVLAATAAGAATPARMASRASLSTPARAPPGLPVVLMPPRLPSPSATLSEPAWMPASHAAQRRWHGTPARAALDAATSGVPGCAPAAGFLLRRHGDKSCYSRSLRSTQPAMCKHAAAPALFQVMAGVAGTTQRNSLPNLPLSNGRPCDRACRPQITIHCRRRPALQPSVWLRLLRVTRGCVAAASMCRSTSSSAALALAWQQSSSGLRPPIVLSC